MLVATPHVQDIRALAQVQAGALLRGKVEAVGQEAVIAEIEDVGNRERRRSVRGPDRS